MKCTLTPYLAAFGAVLAFGLAAPLAHADTIDISVGDRITLDDGTGKPPGGEFDATLQESNGAGGYQDTSVTWATFCLESNEYFAAGELLRVKDISDAATGGGTAGATNGRDPISFATAWLYTEFWNGDLEGLNALGTATSGDYLDNHEDNATHLQQAIWWLEDERGAGFGVDNKYVDLAEAAVNAGWNTLGNVRVLNLERKKNGTWVKAQDQLVMVPVPEPSSVVLLGLGLFGAGFLRRRRRRLTEPAA